MQTLIDQKNLEIPESTTKQQWTDLHTRIILAKKMAGKWLKTSRLFGEKKYGLDYVGEVEVQAELDLGIEMKEKPENGNASDKSKAIVTIEGISQSFKLWQRKIKDDFQNWDKLRLEKALDLLEPIEKQAKEIREKLDAL
jgi:hypothetical protein